MVSVGTAAKQLCGHSWGWKQPWFVALANFSGVNTPTMRLHWKQNQEGMWEAPISCSFAPLCKQEQREGWMLSDEDGITLNNQVTSIVNLCGWIALFSLNYFHSLNFSHWSYLLVLESFLLLCCELWAICVLLNVKIMKEKCTKISHLESYGYLDF